MINISLSKLRNPMKPEEARKYYARVQFTDTFTLEQFAAHVAAHNSKYDEGELPEGGATGGGDTSSRGSTNPDPNA